MESKKDKMRKYLEENIDFDGIQKAKDKSWFKNESIRSHTGNGIIFDKVYKHQKNAIEFVGYNNPTSDKTWNTVIDVTRELIIKHCR